MPENPKQDFSNALPLQGGVAAGLEAVARWEGACFGPAGAVVPAASISGVIFVLPFFPSLGSCAVSA